MIDSLTKAMLWYLITSVILETVPGQLRQSAERVRSYSDIYPAEELWNAAQARPRTAESGIERQKDQLDAEQEQEKDLIEMMEALAGNRLAFSMTTEAPSNIPSDGPSLMPSVIPSDGTSLPPTQFPSLSPFVVESSAPTVSSQPTFEVSPSLSPTVSSLPSAEPSVSIEPSSQPTETLAPSFAPSLSTIPSARPSVSAMPSVNPSVSSSPSEEGATKSPTAEPSLSPTSIPTLTPSKAPTPRPTVFPSIPPSTSFEPSTGIVLTNDPTASSAPSSFPTLADCPGFTSQERINAILDVLFTIADPRLILAVETPHGQATEWLLNRDFDQTCPDDEKLVQRWVLALMYYSSGGDEWMQCSAVGSDPCGTESPFLDRRRFLSSFDECDWAGIVCNTDGCVTEVEFENNNLVGTIPTEMGYLTDLALWGMEQGGLNGTIPTEIGFLTNLVFLDFDFNELSGSLPTEIYLLTGLTELDLNDNRLTGNVDQLGVLTDLEFLQLHANGFSGTIPEEMGNLSQMRVATIYQTFLSGTMPQSVCALRDINGGNLQSLIAECDDIPGAGPQFVCESPTCCTDCRGV